MIDYDNYLKTLSKSELKSILDSIDKNKYPDRYKKAKQIMINYDGSNLAEINNTKEREINLIKRQDFLNLRKKLIPLFTTIRFSCIFFFIGICAYIYLNELSLSDIFKNNNILSSLIFITLSLFSLNEGINLLMKEYYSECLFLKSRAIGMIITGALLMIAVILFTQL